MSDRERLQRWLLIAVYAMVLLCCGAFIGITVAERRAEKIEVIEAPVEHEEITMRLAEAAPYVMPAVSEPEPVSCEDTYLIADHPLDCDLQSKLYSACVEFGVDYKLMLALIDQETDFRNITGDGGDSEGFCQVQKKWWRGLMDEIGAEDLMNPQDNFRTACAIMRQLMDKHGSVEEALSAYNTGRGGQSPYSKSVMAKWEAMK